MDGVATYKQVCSILKYDTGRVGLVENADEAVTPSQRYFLIESKRQIKDFDALYFSENVPKIYFKRLTDFDEERIKEIHRLIWNQSSVPLLYVITPGELRIYNCWERPAGPGEFDRMDDQDRLVCHFELASAALEELDVFSKYQIDTDAFWRSEIGQRFQTERRADQMLLENLTVTRENLHQKGLDYPLVNNLLGRSIFVLFLEDRDVLDKDFYTRLSPYAQTYFDIIRNKEATYTLFRYLSNLFGGDLFPVTEDEEGKVSTSHLNVIRELFLGTAILTGQTRLWRPYDFSVIPIKLLSSIYETFLNKRDRSSNARYGIFYTPYYLVEFVVNELIPWPTPSDHSYDMRIIDPACGSGTFLVEAVRRLIARWEYSHNRQISYHDLKDLITSYIYGIDISRDATNVAAFSLYLMLVDFTRSEEILGKIRFPYLVYRNDNTGQFGRNLFPMDAFSHGPFMNQDYDIVVGNPPWKRDNLPSNISEYCNKKGFAQEMAQAFLWRARDFSPNGRIAMVATSKILFNKERGDRNFRRQFFRQDYVETIVNFSALRRRRDVEEDNYLPPLSDLLVFSSIESRNQSRPKTRYSTVLQNRQMQTSRCPGLF